MKRGVALLVPTILFFLISFANASLSSIWGQSVGFNDLNDWRTFSSPINDPLYDPPLSEGGLDGYWPYSFTINWEISQDLETMLWTYEYTIFATNKYLSHFILEVTNPFIGEESFISDFMINGITDSFEGSREWNGHGNSNPGLPIDSVFGIKFEEGGHKSTFRFTTNLDPVWGNFYAKSGIYKGKCGRDEGKCGKDEGKWVYAYNNALGIEGFNSDNRLDFIVRPDGGDAPPVVPEPISSILFVTGAAVLAGRYYKKTKR